MAKYSVSHEGAEELRNLAAAILRNIYLVLDAADVLKKKNAALSEGLGVFSDDIRNVTSDMITSVTKDYDEMKKLSQLLKDKADSIDELVNMLTDDSVATSVTENGGQHVKSRLLAIRKDAEELGLRAIDRRLEAFEDDLSDKGITNAADVKRELAKKREEMEIEFYDDLYGKVGDNAIKALNSMSGIFSSSNWSRMSPNQRENALNTLAKEAGKAYRTDIKGIRTFDAPPNERGYYRSDGYLYINSDCLTDVSNRMDALDTIFHEGRHAFQHAAILEPSRHGITSEQARKWKDNFDHYLRPERFGYDRYHNQPVEADAYSFAENIIKRGGIV